MDKEMDRKRKMRLQRMKAEGYGSGKNNRKAQPGTKEYSVSAINEAMAKRKKMLLGNR